METALSKFPIQKHWDFKQGLFFVINVTIKIVLF